MKVNTEAYVWRKWLTEKCWNVKLNEFGFLHAYHFPFERLCAWYTTKKELAYTKVCFSNQIGLSLDHLNIHHVVLSQFDRTIVSNMHFNLRSHDIT